MTQISAQSKSSKAGNIDYGITPFATLSTQVSSESPTYGIGGDLFGSYKWNDRTTGLAKMGYYYFQHKNSSQSKLVYQDLHSLLAIKHKNPCNKNIDFVLGYSPMFTLSGIDYYLGIFNDSTGRATIDFTPILKNKFAHGLYAGIEFKSNSNNSIDLGYTYVLNNNSTSTYFDASPSRFTIGYNFYFSKKAPASNESVMVQTTLTQLKTDTLYFINRACSSDFSNGQLDSLLKKNFTFSEYRILTTSEINGSQQLPDAVHFAIIGRHYATLNDPETNGIYLLDKDMNSTQPPYPHYTVNLRSHNSFSLCLGDLQSSAALIRRFNKKLEDKCTVNTIQP